VRRDDPVARVLGYVVGPPIRFVGRRVERRVRHRLGRLPEVNVPEIPEPPSWFVPVVLAVAFVGGILVELRSDRADPDPVESPSERAEPSEAAERCSHPSEGDEDAVAEALETLGMEYPPAPDKDNVEATYRRLVIETHPDQGGDAERFIEVKEAWETVSKREELSADA
jgi:hypothetical protein